LREGARDTTRDLREGARDTAEQAREGSRDLREGSRDAAREVREGARDTTRDLRGESRDFREGTRDATRDLREGARDTARDYREDAQDSRREAREDSRDLREGARDSTRDLREDARDSRESFREERTDLRDDVRRPRQDTGLRDDRTDLRDNERFRDDRSEFRDDRSEFRDDRSEFRDDRSEFREGREDLRDSARSRDSYRESSRSSVRTDTRIDTQNLRPADLGLWFSRSTGQGLVISDVATSGPLGTLISEFGFREGDQIVSVDGYRVARDADFVRYLLADEVLYERVPVVVMRGERRTTLYVEPIRLVEQVQTVQADPLEQFGIILDDRSTDRVLVWRVIPRSPAFYAGIQPGDVITTFHGQRVTSPDAFVQIVERVEPGTIAVEVNRDQRVRQLDVELSQFEGRTAARSALRPEFDDPSIERLSERREDRIEDRREMRFEDGDGYVVPPTRAPAAGPVRRAIFPRLRGR
jgi:hypothetical protein